MVRFFAKLVAFISVFLSSSILWVAVPSEAGEVMSRPAVSAGKFMGIEIETSAVKFHSLGDQKVRFTIAAP